MSLMKQIALVPAGCQPWNLDVCSGCGDRFAYCATLAIYIYQWNTSSREYRLQSIQSEHKKTITAIAWCPYNVDLLVSASMDMVVVVWNVSKQQVVSRLDHCPAGNSPPCSLAWGLPSSSDIAFIGGRGPLNIWHRSDGGSNNGTVKSHPEVRSFVSEVSLMRCHPHDPEKMALGHVDGTISVFGCGQKPLKHIQIHEDTEDIVMVQSIEWDPLSADYLLVAMSNSNIVLVESNTASVVMAFSLPSAATMAHSLAWIHTAPGMFLTGDATTGVLRLWNVSKSTPIENFRLKKSGFRTLFVLPKNHSSQSSNCKSFGCKGNSNERDSYANDCIHGPPLGSAASSCAIPPAQVLCTFLDGGVGVYDLRRKKWNFLRELGHIETIFDCQFHPDDPDILATGSFDGTIKIWDITSLKPVFTSAGNEGIIYSLSWSPGDMHCIAASTSKNGAFIVDVEKGKVIRRFTEHGSNCVYTIAWNHKDSRRIATTGADNYCIIHQVDGKMMMKYKHPNTVYGCDWSPHNADIIATGCGDTFVRVYYLATNVDKELKKFSGHTAKVFRVKWCSLREGILVSGSDDCTVRMWDYTQDSGSIRLFRGHTGPVRGLLWNPEVPYLLMSGSWDYTIRLWDTRDGACVDTVLDHGADVYGLTCHPERPFIVVSCSRDSTFRLWSLTHHVQPLEINILCSRSWNEIIVSPVSGKEHAMTLGTPPLLAGKASRGIKLEVDRLYSSADSRPQIIQMFSKLFASPLGSRNLWDLVKASLGQEAYQLSSSYGKEIVHSRHLTQFKSAAAQEIEMTKLSKFGTGIGAPSREDQLLDAAKLYIRLGNVQRYCDLMVELGQWDKALALAPAVSLEYWSDLINKRSKLLTAADTDEALPYCIASGNAKMTVRFLASRGQYGDAMLVAAAADEGNILPCPVSSKPQTDNRLIKESCLQEASDWLADWSFCNGDSIVAACYHMAIDNHKKAMSKLIRGGELELAASVGLVLNTVKDQLRFVLELLSRRCEKIGCWELGISVLKMVPGTGVAIAQLCSRCAASMSEINHLHESAGLPTLDECVVKAKESANTFEQVMYYILSSSPEIGLDIGLSKVKALITSSWCVDDVDNLLQMMSSLQTERLQNSKCQRHLAELLVLCAYVGALKAISKRFYCIVPSLFQHSLYLLHRDNADVPITEGLIKNELAVWMSIHPNQCDTAGEALDDKLSREEKTVFEQLMTKVGLCRGNNVVELGPYCISGSQLPSHSDVNNSCLDGQRIVGPSYFLEDGHSCISINEAIMWAIVDPFSPLGSGMRINPF